MSSNFALTCQNCFLILAPSHFLMTLNSNSSLLINTETIFVYWSYILQLPWVQLLVLLVFRDSLRYFIWFILSTHFGIFHAFFPDHEIVSKTVSDLSSSLLILYSAIPSMLLSQSSRYLFWLLYFFSSWIWFSSFISFQHSAKILNLLFSLNIKYGFVWWHYLNPLYVSLSLLSIIS